MEYIKTIESYCFSCKKNTANKNSNVRRTKQNRFMLVSSCTICGKKKPKFKKLPGQNSIEQYSTIVLIQ